ncbi:MAG: right-handed parallel beta-helix repeat-containing protein [Candidatus Rokubacteria bacterium]|nr:right-handed parallel beta-helix repeat-containing protein [Candidatus Rokubacteria bacterium]
MWRVFAQWLLVAAAAAGAARPAAGGEIGPGADWCAALRMLKPGEELSLRAGDYQGPCGIRAGGAPGAPVVLRAADPARRPRIVYQGSTSNVLEIRASHVIVRGLEFGPSLPGVDAVRVFGGEEVTVEECRFLGPGGIAVVANHASVRGLTVRRNEILSPWTTAMYFGCHDGRSCTVSDLLVERNFVRDVTAPDPQIGYGVQIKANSSGIVRDNVIVDTKGPGIMVYGAGEARGPSLVERNLVMGSRSSSGIVVGGGPAVVRNNIAVGNAVAGIGLEDFRGRGWLRGVVVAHNTIYANGAAGIQLPSNGPLEVVIVNNAVNARAGTPALPLQRTGVTLAGNVDCSVTACFARPEAGDFSPLAGSALGHGTAGAGTRLLQPGDDFFGVRRGVAPIPGAIERAAGPVPLGIKP